MHRILGHLRANVIAYLAIVLAVGATGGYAIAATSSKSIHACVVKKTGELLVKARCSGGQTKLTWNQQGPQGLQGKTGSTGAPGQAPPSAWAIVSPNGQSHGQGLTAQNVSAGVYTVTVTAAACAGKQNAPVVDVSSSNPPGSFPLAWVGDAGSSPFTVYTGVVTGGTFTATDETFNVQDVCG
jgi:hypothetical protein